MCLLKRLVENDAPPTKLEFIRKETYPCRFVGSDNFNLAYLIEPPAEPKYKPFLDAETAFNTITAHGGWLKGDDTYYLVTGVNLIKEVEIRIRDYWISAKYVFENFTFADDGTPVGVKIEDTAPEEYHADK